MRVSRHAVLRYLNRYQMMTYYKQLGMSQEQLNRANEEVLEKFKQSTFKEHDRNTGAKIFINLPEKIEFVVMGHTIVTLYFPYSNEHIDPKVYKKLQKL